MADYQYLSEIRESNPPHRLGKTLLCLDKVLILNILIKSATAHSHITHKNRILLHFCEYVHHTNSVCCKLHQVDFRCRHKVGHIHITSVKVHRRSTCLDSSVLFVCGISLPCLVASERHCHRSVRVPIDYYREVSLCAKDAAIQE